MRPTRMIMIFGFLVMAAMLIYPPWVHQEESGKPEPMGYGFIWQAPQRELSAEFLGLKFSASEQANSIDFSRLAVQELVALVILAGAVALSGAMSQSRSEELFDERISSEKSKESALR